MAIGGDGAAHAGLQAVAGTGTPLAVVPAGTAPLRPGRPRRTGPAAPRGLTLVLDGEPRTLTATLVAVGNTARYGGGMRIRPDADPADGAFDLTVVGPVSRREPVAPLPVVDTCVPGALAAVGAGR